MTITNSRAAAVLLFISLLAAANVGAQEGVAESQQYLRDAAQLQAAGDDAGAIRALETARALNPASLYTRYNLAAAYARTGDTQRALDLLAALARARVDFGVSEDADFAALHDRPQFEALLEQLALATAPQVNSQVHYEVQRIDLVPEGIAWDAAGQKLLFGSMRTGEIFALDGSGQVTKFAELRHATPLAAIGMTVDEKRGLLWVIGSPSFLTERQDAEADALAGVFAFDVATGKERLRFLSDDAGYGFNDVTVAPDGDVYLSGEFLSVLRDGTGPLRRLATSVPVYGSNGIVVTADNRHLITASYPSGIAVVRLSDGVTHFLRAPDNTELYGIDGLYLYDGDLVAIQNGIKPWRLMRFALAADLSEITDTITIDFGNPLITATTGAIVGDQIRFIGQGPAKAELPPHVPEQLREYAGRTAIMTAPLD